MQQIFVVYQMCYFQYTDTDSMNKIKKISSKLIQPTGFWTIHFIEALFCDCSCVPAFWIIAFMLNVMKNYPKSLQELTRRKSWEKIGIVQNPSALSKLLLIFESDLMNPVSSVLKAYLITANPNLKDDRVCWKRLAMLYENKKVDEINMIDIRRMYAIY